MGKFIRLAIWVTKRFEFLCHAFLFIFQSLNLITLFQIWGCHAIPLYYDDDANTTTTYGYLITKLAKLSRIFDNSFNKGMLLFQKSIFGHPTQVPTYTHWYTPYTHTSNERKRSPVEKMSWHEGQSARLGIFPIRSAS